MMDSEVCPLALSFRAGVWSWHSRNTSRMIRLRCSTSGPAALRPCRISWLLALLSSPWPVLFHLHKHAHTQTHKQRSRSQRAWPCPPCIPALRSQAQAGLCESGSVWTTVLQRDVAAFETLSPPPKKAKQEKFTAYLQLSSLIILH